MSSPPFKAGSGVPKYRQKPVFSDSCFFLFLYPFFAYSTQQLSRSIYNLSLILESVLFLRCLIDQSGTLKKFSAKALHFGYIVRLLYRNLHVYGGLIRVAYDGCLSTKSPKNWSVHRDGYLNWSSLYIISKKQAVIPVMSRGYMNLPMRIRASRQR